MRVIYFFTEDTDPIPWSLVLEPEIDSFIQNKVHPFANLYIPYILYEYYLINGQQNKRVNE